MQLNIDEEFKSLLPPLTAEEFQQLKENILRDGCMRALVIWNGIIIDGNNRYKICTENNIPFDTVNMEFTDRLEVKKWMIENQLGQRNLNDFGRAEIVLRNDELIAEITERARENQGSRTDLQHFDPVVKKLEPINKRKIMADMSHTSEGTIQRSKLIIEKGTEDQINRARNGEAVKKIYNEIKGTSETKICGKCGVEKPLTGFYKNSRDGYSCYCKECENSRVKESHKLSGIPQEIRNIPDDELIGNLYDIDGVPEYTLEDLAEEVRGKVNEFNRVMRAIMESHSELLQSDADYMRLEAELKNITTKLLKI